MCSQPLGYLSLVTRGVKGEEGMGPNHVLVFKCVSSVQKGNEYLGQHLQRILKGWSCPYWDQDILSSSLLQLRRS